MDWSEPPLSMTLEVSVRVFPQLLLLFLLCCCCCFCFDVVAADAVADVEGLQDGGYRILFVEEISLLLSFSFIKKCPSYTFLKSPT